ncbi:MAG: cysteine rich repeat-containing protein [Pseudolabrys sp.]
MTKSRTTRRTALWSCLAALAFASVAGSAQAQLSSAQQSALKQHCRSDFMAKCSGVTPGGKDALTCLQKNVAGLSPGCKTAVSATLPPPAPAAAAPAPTAPAPAAVAAPTAPAAPTAAAPVRPASAAAPVTSAPPPKAKVAPAPRRAAVAPPPPPPAPAAAAPAAAPTAAQQNAMKQNCRNDFMTLCRGVQPGGKEAFGCLQKNVGALSAACKSVVSATMGAPAAAATPAATPAAVTTAPPPAAPAARPPKAPVVNAAVMLRACKLDLVRHCRGVDPGGGRAIACLSANQNNLTIRCRTAMQVTSPLR